MKRSHATWPLAGVLTGLVILVSGTLPGEAYPGRRGELADHPTLREELGLTDDQVQAVRELLARQRASLRETARALREARRALRDLVLQEADDAAIAAKEGEVQALLSQLVAARTRSLRELAGILTPEQRARLRELGPLRRHRGASLAG
jgi:Spy/CpxP family protein refolding chaperone